MDEFINRSEEEVYLAIMDRLGVKLMPGFECDDNDRSWAYPARNVIEGTAQ